MFCRNDCVNIIKSTYRIEAGLLTLKLICTIIIPNGVEMYSLKQKHFLKRSNGVKLVSDNWDNDDNFNLIKKPSVLEKLGDQSRLYNTAQKIKNTLMSISEHIL